MIEDCKHNRIWVVYNTERDGNNYFHRFLTHSWRGCRSWASGWRKQGWRWSFKLWKCSHVNSYYYPFLNQKGGVSLSGKIGPRCIPPFLHHDLFITRNFITLGHLPELFCSQLWKWSLFDIKYSKCLSASFFYQKKTQYVVLNYFVPTYPDSERE